MTTGLKRLFEDFADRVCQTRRALDDSEEPEERPDHKALARLDPQDRKEFVREAIHYRYGCDRFSLRHDFEFFSYLYAPVAPEAYWKELVRYAHLNPASPSSRTDRDAVAEAGQLGAELVLNLAAVPPIPAPDANAAARALGEWALTASVRLPYEGGDWPVSNLGDDDLDLWEGLLKEAEPVEIARCAFDDDPDET